MKILKFKKTSKDKYKLFLDNNEVITLYEDVIIDNDLLIKNGYSEDGRAEALPIEMFVEISNCL